MITSFSQFILERYEQLPTDTSAMSINKRELNKLQNWISEYRRKSTIVYNIYMRYEKKYNADGTVDDSDLLRRLKAQKIVTKYEVDENNPIQIKQVNAKQMKQVGFVNPLLAEVAAIAAKKREIEDINKDVQKQQDTIKDRQDSISAEPQLKPSFDEDIKKIQDKISTKSKEIEELRKEISQMELQLRAKFNQMRIEYDKKSKVMLDDIQDRRQTEISKEQ